MFPVESGVPHRASCQPSRAVSRWPSRRVSAISSRAVMCIMCRPFAGAQAPPAAGRTPPRAGCSSVPALRSHWGGAAGRPGARSLGRPVHADGYRIAAGYNGPGACVYLLVVIIADAPAGGAVRVLIVAGGFSYVVELRRAGRLAEHDPVGCGLGQGVIGAARGVEFVGPVSIAQVEPGLGNPTGPGGRRAWFRAGCRCRCCEWRPLDLAPWS